MEHKELIKCRFCKKEFKSIDGHYAKNKICGQKMIDRYIRKRKEAEAEANN